MLSAVRRGMLWIIFLALLVSAVPSPFAATLLFATPRTHTYLLADEHAPALHEYYTANAAHLAPWEPRRPDGYHSLAAWQARVIEFAEEQTGGEALRMLSFRPGDQQLVAVCAFTNISRGVFQACNLGYSIAAAQAGQGLMTEIVEAAVAYVFRELDLHRVMASYVPDNQRSARVLEKVGFSKEGLARSYLQINGRWRDHVLTAKLNPEHEG